MTTFTNHIIASGMEVQAYRNPDGTMMCIVDGGMPSGLTEGELRVLLAGNMVTEIEIDGLIDGADKLASYGKYRPIPDFEFRRMGTEIGLFNKAGDKLWDSDFDPDDYEDEEHEISTFIEEVRDNHFDGAIRAAADEFVKNDPRWKAHKASTAATGTMAGAMLSASAAPTAPEPKAPVLSAADEEARQKALEELRAANEEVKAIRIANLDDAVRMIRASCIILSGTGSRLIDAGLLGHLEAPMQRMIKTMVEIEADYQGEIAGTPVPTKAAEEVPEILTAFLKRSELEAAEAVAKREAEAAAARAAAAAAARAATPSYGDEEPSADHSKAAEELAKKDAEEREKVDAFFKDVDIFAGA